MDSTQLKESAAHPPIASAEEWLAARKQLLEAEKELTRQSDRVNAQRRRLPMVEITKAYSFDGPEGRRSLLDLFDGQRQLIVYHFMFDPEWDKGCDGCTSLVDALGDLSDLAKNDTAFALISRAPLEKLEKFKALHGWPWRWYSSHDSDFNYDFHATYDESRAPILANFRTQAEREARGATTAPKGETHGMSVFFLHEGKVHHTYSAYARGVENLVHSYALLDITPWGRQQDFEDSPPGWPQKPTYG